MQSRSQQGITIIELLIALSILTLIGTLIWGVFFQGTKYTANEVTKNLLQQEANGIISKLNHIHQTANHYSIESSSCSITVNYEDKHGVHSTVFMNDRFCYLINENDTASEDNYGPENFTPKDGAPINLWIHLNEVGNPSNKYKLEFYLHRLKGDGDNG